MIADYGVSDLYAALLTIYRSRKRIRCYAHTNQFCVVQENIIPEVLKVQIELARPVHHDRGLYILLYNDKTG